jgi:Fe2+ or Zn2+ uptake regulation protein
VKPRRTEKQKELMGLILKAAGEGKFLTVTELHAQISYPASYGAVRISLNFLEGQGMIEKTKQGQHTLLVPTDRGYDWFRPRTS